MKGMHWWRGEVISNQEVEIEGSGKGKEKEGEAIEEIKLLALSIIVGSSHIGWTLCFRERPMHHVC